MEKAEAERLLTRAEHGNLSLKGLSAVVGEIRAFQDDPNRKNDGNTHTLLHAIGYAGMSYPNMRQEYRRLIEKFLYFPRAPFVTVTTLDVLCNDWDLTHDYIEQIKSFMKGVEWDTEWDVRVKAMGIAGEYIKQTGDKKCLKILLEIFENKQERNVIREIAYYFICRGMGQEYGKIRDINIDDFPQDSAAQELIAEASQFSQS